MGDRLRLRLLSSDEVSTMREKCFYLLSTQGMKIDHERALAPPRRGRSERRSRGARRGAFRSTSSTVRLKTVPPRTDRKGAEEERHDCHVPHPDGAVLLMYEHPEHVASRPRLRTLR